MTIDEVGKLLTILQAEYPTSFSRMDDRQMQLKTALWESEFREDEFTKVYAAVRLLMKSGREFAPNIGQIREKLRQMEMPDELDEGAAWALVCHACKNGIHNSIKEFEKLPPEVQAAVGSPEQIRAWSLVDEDELQTVIGSNFKRSYRTGIQRARDRAMIGALPTDKRELIEGLSGKLALKAAEANREPPGREREGRDEH